jgi:hypothetical protein
MRNWELWCSACTEPLPVHLILGTIWGSHGGEYVDGCLLGCSAVWSGSSSPAFQKSLLLTSSAWLPWWWGRLLPDYTAVQPRRQPSSYLGVIPYFLLVNVLVKHSDMLGYPHTYIGPGRDAWTRRFVFCALELRNSSMVEVTVGRQVTRVCCFESTCHRWWRNECITGCY